MKLTIAFCILATLALPASAGKTTTEIGKFNAGREGGATFDVIEEKGQKTVGFFIHDATGIRYVYWRMTPEKAKELHKMLGESIAEAEVVKP